MKNFFMFVVIALAFCLYSFSALGQVGHKSYNDCGKCHVQKKWPLPKQAVAIQVEKGWTRFHVGSNPIDSHVTMTQAIRAYGQAKGEIKLRQAMLREYNKGVTSTGEVDAGQKFILCAFWNKNNYPAWGYKQVLASGTHRIEYFGESFRLGRQEVRLARILTCKNPVLLKSPPIKIRKASPPVVPEEPTPPSEPVTPSLPVAPPEVKQPLPPVSDKPDPIPPMPPNFPGGDQPLVDWSGCGELTSGAGFYESVNWPHTGFYHWTHGRCLPISLSGKWRLGANAGYALGSGSDNGFRYDWLRYYVGPSVKKFFDEASIGFDAAIGKQFNDGHEGGYKENQDATILRFGVDYDNWARKLTGNDWFSKFKLGLNAVWQIDAHKNSSYNDKPLTSKTWDNSSVELTLTQGIYDIKLGKNIVLTPSAKVGIGRDFGPEVNFAKFGPMLEIEAKGEKIFELGVVNYKANFTNKVNDQVEWISGMWDIGGTWRAIEKSLITDVTEEPLPSAAATPAQMTAPDQPVANPAVAPPAPADLTVSFAPSPPPD